MSLARGQAREHHSAQFRRHNPGGTILEGGNEKRVLASRGYFVHKSRKLCSGNRRHPLDADGTKSDDEVGRCYAHPLRTKEPLSSATAKVGDRVPFRVTEDVKAGDLIVIQRGAEAWGVVTAAQPKRRKGRAGSLEVAIQSVQLLNEDRAALRAEEHSKGAGKSLEMGLQMAQLAMTGLALPLVPFLLLEKGEDARLPAGTKFTAYLNGDVPLDRAAFEKVQPVIGQPSGPATVTIFRTKWPAATAYKPSAYCGNIALARLSYGAYLKVQLPPENTRFGQVMTR